MKMYSLLLALVLIGCSKDSPTEPVVAPTVSGVWNMQASTTTQTLYGSMNVTESAGRVSGIYTVSTQYTPITVNGSISMNLLTCEGLDGTAYRYVLECTVNGERTQMSGSLKCYNQK
jgi:hypothetical protein